MIVWLNGAHGVGKTTVATLLTPRISGARVLDAEKIGAVLMDVQPPLPDLGNFQHWNPWRPLVAETARRVLDYTGGALIMPMTVLVERYWREIIDGLAGVEVRHVLLHAAEPTLRRRIDRDPTLGPSRFRHAHVAQYSAAFDGWLGRSAEVIDTSSLSPAEVADCVVAQVS